jgi:hypothetical protein
VSIRGGCSLIYAAFFGAACCHSCCRRSSAHRHLGGMVVAPVGIAPILGSRFVGRYYDRVDRLLITTAFLITAGSCGGAHTRHRLDALDFTAAQLLLGWASSCSRR